ncbi:MAG TPA: protein-methionine-sulfoxide reductase heme-binding subunit MsrQ, partial [Longimicrobiales bacterium]|nr:protein-methionine-sulfoxide reductase heme-binding subunit MsrQ [Longimicrobiales bacterium]
FVLWLGALAPASWLIAAHFLDWLGANPIEKLTHVTGMTTLVLLLVTLAVTPVRRVTRWNPVIQLRRPLGLFAFFYACLHFSIWMVLDLGFQLEWVWEDIAERPYITVGFSAFLILIPLAVTSTKGWMRRLGRRWSRLHRGIYLAAALGAIHYYWLVKADVRLPLLLAGILGVLLATRVWFWWSGRGARHRRRAVRAASAEGGRDRTPDAPPGGRPAPEAVPGR